MNSEEQTGHVREKELYDALARRFGSDCVYLNSKYRHPNGVERELWDVFVLSLPYAVVFQMKWRDRTAKDFTGENADVEVGRLDKRLNAAVKQFREFLTLYENHAVITLPRAWRHQGGVYELPLDVIETIIPVVVVDFDDPDYPDPKLRTSLGPRVTNSPDCIKSFGAVHSFLFKDLIRIVDEMFTIGDLVTYLTKRRQMIESGVGFLRYSEMDLFSLYQTDFPLWEKLLDRSMAIVEPGIFEAKKAKHREAFAQRQRFFASPDIVDGIVDEIMRSAVDDMSCLQNLGRFRLMTSVMKKEVSRVLCENIRKFLVPTDAKICGMRRSIGNFSSEILPGTFQCVVVFNGTTDQMEEVATYCYLRTLRRVIDLGKESVAKEVLIIIVSAVTPASYVELRPIRAEEYSFALSQEEIEESRFDYSEHQIKLSEWGYMKENGNDTR